jgi:Zn-dependent protease with chaperone function
MAPNILTAEILSQGIFHSLVAALFVEALMRSWSVRHPAQRGALRLVALAYPVLIFPPLVLLFPNRADESFRDAALLSGRRWSDVAFLGLDLHWAFILSLAGLGVLMLAVDVVSLAHALRRGRPRPVEPDEHRAEALRAALAPLAWTGPRPPVVYLDRPLPGLFCSGVRRPTIYITRGAIDLLDAGELRASLAHELAHLGRRDPQRSWAMLALRCAMGWNPTFQVLARAMAQDAERLADERGVELGADRLALASALLKLHRATGGTGATAGRRTLVFGGRLEGTLRRARSHDVEQRVRALLESAPEPLRLPWLRIGLAATSMTGLLYFVT